MTSTVSDTVPEATRQPPAVLAAWIQDQLREVRGAQLSRLAEIATKLKSEAFEWDSAALSQAVADLDLSARELNLEELRMGWLARQLGKHRPVYARFADAYGRTVAAATRLDAEADRLAADRQNHNAVARRVVVELNIEWKALQAAVEQGVSWLQDMCEQINAKGNAPIADPQLNLIAEAAQSFTRRFKRLQTVASTAREAGVRGETLIERRTALLDQVRADVQFFQSTWMRAVGGVHAAVEAGSPVTAGEAIDVHDELALRLGITAESCAALRQEEQLIAEHLEALIKLLETAR